MNQTEPQEVSLADRWIIKININHNALVSTIIITCQLFVSLSLRLSIDTLGGM